MTTRVIVFLEVVALIGAVAYFSAQHTAHLSRLQEKLEVIEKAAKASESALSALVQTKEEIAHARAETDRKLQEACTLDDAAAFGQYCRLLREDADRRASAAGSPGGAAGSVQ